MTNLFSQLLGRAGGGASRPVGMRGGQSISPSTFRALFHCLLFKKHFVPFRCSLKIMHHFFLGAFKFSIFSSSARMFLGDFLLLVLIKFVELSRICGFLSFAGLLKFSASTVHMRLPHRPLPRISGASPAPAPGTRCFPNAWHSAFSLPSPPRSQLGLFYEPSRVLSRPHAMICFSNVHFSHFTLRFWNVYMLLSPLASIL